MEIERISTNSQILDNSIGKRLWACYIRMNTRPTQLAGRGQGNVLGHSVRLLARISEM